MMRSRKGARVKVSVAAVTLVVLMMAGSGWAQGSEPGQAPAQTSGQGSGQAQGQQLPDAPGETKPNESGGPVHEVEQGTKQAAEMTGRLAEAGLIRARNWESTWIAGVYVANDQTLITLTAKQ